MVGVEEELLEALVHLQTGEVQAVERVVHCRHRGQEGSLEVVLNGAKKNFKRHPGAVLFCDLFFYLFCFVLFLLTYFNSFCRLYVLMFLFTFRDLSFTLSIFNIANFLFQNIFLNIFSHNIF